MIEPQGAAERPYPTHEEIAQRAFFHWEERGRPEESPEIDWLRAEQEFLEERRGLAADHGQSGAS